MYSNRYIRLVTRVIILIIPSILVHFAKCFHSKIVINLCTGLLFLFLLEDMNIKIVVNNCLPYNTMLNVLQHQKNGYKLTHLHRELLLSQVRKKS